MLREVTELSTRELFERWQRFYLQREDDPSSALATNIQLIERLETERADAILAMFYDDAGATGKIGRMLHLTPKATQHLMDRLFRERARAVLTNGNGKG